MTCCLKGLTLSPCVSELSEEGSTEQVLRKFELMSTLSLGAIIRIIWYDIPKGMCFISSNIICNYIKCTNVFLRNTNYFWVVDFQT